MIPDRGRTWVVAVGDIEWLEAADNYVVVHAGARAPLLRRTLTALLADLGETFVRTQRGAAVALAHVASVQALAEGRRAGADAQRRVGAVFAAVSRPADATVAVRRLNVGLSVRFAPAGTRFAPAPWRERTGAR